MASRSSRHHHSSDAAPQARDPSVRDVRATARGLSRARIQRIEEQAERPSSYYGGGVTGNFLQGKYGTDAIHAWFQERHRVHSRIVQPDGFCRLVDADDPNIVHEWKVPYGVRQALATPLIHAQIVNRYPFYVTWVSPRTHKRLRKYEATLATSIILITERVQYVDPDASIVSRIGYHVPPALRGKLPHPKLGYWCPCCMTARPYFPTVPEQVIYVTKKVWSDEKRRYIYVERKVRLLKCKACGLSNRDHKFRVSNQPWQIRRFKSGATRAPRL